MYMNIQDPCTRRRKLLLLLPWQYLCLEWLEEILGGGKPLAAVYSSRLYAGLVGCLLKPQSAECE